MLRKEVTVLAGFEQELENSLEKFSLSASALLSCR